MYFRPTKTDGINVKSLAITCTEPVMIKLTINKWHEIYGRLHYALVKKIEISVQYSIIVWFPDAIKHNNWSLVVKCCPL